MSGIDFFSRYSGVRRQDFPPLGSRENKYTPPAKRAPSSQATVSGAPVDPAIISSQVRAPVTKTPIMKPEEGKDAGQSSPKATAASNVAADPASNLEAKQITAAPKAAANKNSDIAPSGPIKAPADAKKTESKSPEKANTPLRPSTPSSRTISPQVKEGAPSAASTVERDVLNSFKTFATQQRQTADKIRTSKARADKEVKLTELKKFANSFKLSTPVPSDLISIIAKDPLKQQEIQAKALQNVQEVARSKVNEPAGRDKSQIGKETQAKTAAPAQSPHANSDSRSTPRPTVPPQYASSPGAPNSNRQAHPRQAYATPHHGQSFRNDRPNSQHLAQQGRQPLAQRLRNVEQQKMTQSSPAHTTVPEMRVPPTGPANNTDPSFGRRLSAAPSGHQPAKLNPHSNEFKPNPFASTFSPNGGHPSAGSSPRSAAANNIADGSSSFSSGGGQLVRRKTKAIDVKKCFILAHVKTMQPPTGRNWDDNDSIRPSFDTAPTWRQIAEGGEGEGTMSLTYKEYLDKQSFATPSITPNPPHVSSATAHHYQLPLHMQQGGQPRHSPNMSTMSMHGQHGHNGAPTYNGMDDHRMMPSNSAQSFASPRISQPGPMGYGPAMNSPGQVPYNPQIMQPFMGNPGTPQMGGQFRNFSSSQGYMPQMGPMGNSVMMPPHFPPQGMVPTPQMNMYGQFVPPNAAPPQSVPGANGYPSPGRPAAPMMAHQGSQQGQAVYGMSPSVQYQQPAYPQQHPNGQGMSPPFFPSHVHYQHRCEWLTT